MDYKLARALLEKIAMNGEEIGKLKLEPFSVPTVERVRAFYKENDKLVDQILRSLKTQNADKETV
jgi:hypothetical protein